MWNSVRAVVFQWRKRTETQEQMEQSEDPLRHVGRQVSPSLECIWERWHHISRDKRATGATVLPSSLA